MLGSPHIQTLNTGSHTHTNSPHSTLTTQHTHHSLASHSPLTHSPLAHHLLPLSSSPLTLHSLTAQSPHTHSPHKTHTHHQRTTTHSPFCTASRRAGWGEVEWRQGWEITHLISEQIASFLSKNERMSNSIKKMSDLLIRSFLVSNLSDLLTIAHFL